ncbi:MAG: hypothetical protein GWN29_04825 [Gammaproteobacteria bacterium]|nr:hypothetical protein [Gammaproteobacteria bacterium]NIW23929.1 hypothetical protein [Gammaproteobacteria bacterium]NIX85022.1 hypothetical protein [Gammaproteobacteria bacterium]
MKSLDVEMPSAEWAERELGIGDNSDPEATLLTFVWLHGWLCAARAGDDVRPVEQICNEAASVFRASGLRASIVDEAAKRNINLI